MTKAATRMLQPPRPPARGQRGVMLIEALVGILIFSVGILALMVHEKLNGDPYVINTLLGAPVTY